MEAKYYTPTIEEFHVGFQFEYYNELENYAGETIDNEKIVFTVNGKYPLEIIEDWVNNELVRVPYLTKEQIEAEGFEYMEVKYGDWLGFKKTNEDRTKTLISYYTDRKISIGIENAWGDEVFTKFKGTIKNISEFRVLCKQLNIKK